MVSREEAGKLIESYKDEMIDTLSKMVPIKAISPMSGGEGESKRADFLQDFLKKMGIETKRFEYTDPTGAKRPNLVAKYGNKERTVWIIGHIDTVSEGDITLWGTDPFKVVVKDGRIYGRGTSDDGQGVIIGVYALKALMNLKADLKYNYGLILAADEEIGSKYGMRKLMDENLFRKGDMFVVPDWGTSEGDTVETGEKGRLWLKITVNGKQTHASTPENGVNAFKYASKFLTYADQTLYSKYNATNKIFDPPNSTFEMTKHEKNVDSVNIIPGTDVSYIDCRVLPEYKLEDVINDVESIAKGPEFSKVKITIEISNKEESAPPTSENSEIVKLLGEAIKSVSGKTVKKIGIGGGTVATYTRLEGFDSVVWSTLDPVAHQPNEYALTENIINDTKVIAYLFV